MQRILVAIVLVCAGMFATVRAEEKPASGGPSFIVHVRMLQLNRSRLSRTPGEIDADGRLVRLEQAFLESSEVSQVESSHEKVMWKTIGADKSALDAVFNDWRDRLQALAALAEPTLTVQNGEATHYHRGAMLRVPVRTSQGRVTWEARRMGTIIDCRADAAENGSISLDLFCQHKTHDAKSSTTLNGYTLPGIRVDFDVSLTAQLREGQALVLTGLRSSRTQNDELVELESILIVAASSAAQADEIDSER